MPRLQLILIASLLSVPTGIAAQDQTALAQDMTQEEYNRLALFYAVLQAVIAAVAIVAGIAVTFYLYWREQKERRLEIISRSCQTILWELADNSKTLSEDKYQKISYQIAGSGTSSSGQTDENRIIYTNAYLHDEAYRSVSNTGSFGYFSSGTQYKLVSLYGRIASHNALLTYLDELQDQILIAQTQVLSGYSKEESERVQEKGNKILFDLRERYDITLTKWEREIRVLIPEVEKLIREENPASKS